VIFAASSTEGVFAIELPAAKPVRASTTPQ